MKTDVIEFRGLFNQPNYFGRYNPKTGAFVNGLRTFTPDSQ